MVATLLLALGVHAMGAAGAAPVRRVSQVVSGAVAPSTSTPTPGAGWFLTTIEDGKVRDDGGLKVTSRRLVLIDPAGAQTDLWRRAQQPMGNGYFQLADWTVDGRKALLFLNPYRPSAKAVIYDLATDSTTMVRLDEDVSQLQFAPGGQSLLSFHYGPDRAQPMQEISFHGTKRETGIRTLGSVLPGVDGHTVYAAPVNFQVQGIRALDLETGKRIRSYPTEGHCLPIRWWAESELLLRCHPGSQKSTLATLDVQTGKYQALTRPAGPARVFLADLDARLLGSRLFVQEAGPCAFVFLARQRGDGSLTQVEVPGTSGSVGLVGATDDRLVLRFDAGCESSDSRQTLALFDPATEEVDVLFETSPTQQLGPVANFGELRYATY